MRKLESHIKTGDVGRDELIREYEQQQARMEKALNINKNTFERLKRDKIVQNDLNDFVRNLKAVDPKLVGSSKQFAAFKTVLMELDRAKQSLDENNPEAVAAYKELVNNAAEKAAVYLRFKSYQNNGPDKDEHKRSDLEVKRINGLRSIICCV